MKVLIWFVLIVLASIAVNPITNGGIRLGGLPVTVIYGIALLLIRLLCKAWDTRKSKKTAAEEESSKQDDSPPDNIQSMSQPVMPDDTVEGNGLFDSIDVDKVRSAIGAEQAKEETTSDCAVVEPHSSILSNQAAVSRKEKKRAVWLIILCCSCVVLPVLVLSICELLGMGGVTEKSTVSTPVSVITKEPEVTLMPALNLPNNKLCRFFINKERLAPFEVNLSSEDSNYYYIVLTDYTTGKKVVSLFLYPGTSFKTTVPLGKYCLYYTCGETWYGWDNLFSDEGYCGKADEAFIFYADADYYKGYTLTLHPVYNGNLDFESIPMEDFPA